jgi:predicted permease
MSLSFHIEGRPEPVSPADETIAWTRIVSPSYVTTMGMRLVAGRDLNSGDSERAVGAVLVNETMARRFWPGASPLGARLQIAGFTATVAGVVGDVHHRGPAATPTAEMFVPFTQFSARQAVVVLRTAGDPAGLAAPLRAVMRDVDPSLPLANIITMDTLFDRVLSQASFLAVLLGGFALLAGVLAVVGIYGLLSFIVNGRVRELGVRMALGAGRGRILGLVLGRSGWLVGTGIASGAVAAAILTRVLRSILFGVRPGDPLTFVVMGAAVAAAALLASVPPALRAARVDPVVALREN